MKVPYLSRRIARLRKSFARRLGPLLASMLQNSAFFLQSQMDINPKSIWHRKDFIDATGGYQGSKDETRVVGQLLPFDVVRRDALILLLRSVIERKVPGDFVEEPVLVFPNAENATVLILDVFAKSAQVWVKPFAIRNLAQHPCAVAAILRGLRKAGATVLATTQHGCA